MIVRLFLSAHAIEQGHTAGIPMAFCWTIVPLSCTYRIYDFILYNLVLCTCTELIGYRYQDLGCNVRLFSSGEQDNNENLVGDSDRNVESFIVDC